MSDKEKILKTLSSLLETGILTANDVKKELITNFKFKKENIVNKLDLVSREEFEVLKALVEKQNLKIEKLSKKTKKAKKSKPVNHQGYFSITEYSPHGNGQYPRLLLGPNLRQTCSSFYFYQV